MKSGGNSLVSGLSLLVAVYGSALAQEGLSAADNPRLNPLGVSRTSDLKAFSERPLFVPSRRPAAAEEVATDTEPEKNAEPEFELVLLGITSGPDGSIARIAAGGDKANQSLRKGETTEGWTLEAIDASSVTIVRNGETKVLTIFSDSAKDATDSDTERAASDLGIVFGSENPADQPVPKVRVVDPN